MTKRNLPDISFLFALKLGEHHTFSIVPTASEKHLKAPRFKRLSYYQLNQALYALNHNSKGMRFPLRMGSPHGDDKDEVRVYCVEQDGKKFEPPPPKGGFSGEVAKHKKKLEKAAELPKQIEKAREEAAPKPHDPPHLRPMTVDDQMKLVTLVQAHAAGETIQVLTDSTGSWVDVHGDSLNWKLPVARLRVKPKPRRAVWIQFTDDNGGGRTTTKKEVAESWRKEGLTVAEFREVFPDEEEDT